MDYIGSVEVPQPGVAFAVVSNNNLTGVIKTLAEYGTGHKVRCVGIKGPFKALTVYFKEPLECVNFYTAFAKVEDISTRANWRRNRAKVAARQEKIGSTVAVSE